MRRTVSFLVALSSLPAGLALTASGCEPQVGGPIPLVEFRSEMEAAQCEYAVRCGQMPDAATCTASRTLDSVSLQLLADVGFGLVKYDETRGRACVEFVRVAPCMSTVSAVKATAAGCDGAFVGSVTDGERCFVDGECASKFCDRTACAGVAGCCEGTCSAGAAFAKEGDECSNRPCDEGLYCVFDGMTGTFTTCAKTKGNGQDCVQDTECGDTQACDPGALQCYVLSPPGGACNPLLDLPSCLAFNESCSEASQKCEVAPGPGELCGQNFRCLGTSVCDGATCQPRSPEGGVCDAAALPCLGNLVCNNAICEKPPLPTVCAFGLP